ncbi:MAG: hypothetical protein OJF49_004284 [Ktedonobacterales bacterium]|nr:MAG: hypothetical protein OJF49_004284 [Ktedonobacterales bacterium]
MYSRMADLGSHTVIRDRKSWARLSPLSDGAGGTVIAT